LRRGDRVVTQGGLLGTVTKVVSDTELQVEIADGVRVRVVRATIQDVISKPEPADKAAGKSKDGNGAAKAANDDGGAAEKPKSALAGLSSLVGGGRKPDKK